MTTNNWLDEICLLKMLSYSLAMSKGLGHEQELWGEDMEGPFVKKVGWLQSGACSSWRTSSPAVWCWSPRSHPCWVLTMTAAGWLGGPGPPSRKRDPQRSAAPLTLQPLHTPYDPSLTTSPMLLTPLTSRPQQEGPHLALHPQIILRLCPYSWLGYTDQRETWVLPPKPRWQYWVILEIIFASIKNWILTNSRGNNNNTNTMMSPLLTDSCECATYSQCFHTLWKECQWSSVVSWFLSMILYKLIITKTPWPWHWIKPGFHQERNQHWVHEIVLTTHLTPADSNLMTNSDKSLSEASSNWVTTLMTERGRIQQIECRKT